MTQHSASEQADATANAQLTLLHFMVQDLQCCLHVQDVERIMSLLDMRPVPGSPDYLIGLINLHGTSIYGIDLGMSLGYPRTEAYNIDTPIILCANNDKRIGLAVSEILDIQECDPQAMQMRPEFKQGAQPYHAVVNTQRGLSLLLDIERLIDVQLSIVTQDPIEHLPNSKENSAKSQRL